MIAEKSYFKDYSIFNMQLNNVSFSEKLVINTINQYSYCMAENDSVFKKALIDSDILLPDGVGIVMAVKILNNDNITKISGSDIHKYLIDKLDKANGKSFYLGSSEKTLKKINSRLANEYPNISSNYYSPPFTPNFSDEANQIMIRMINDHSPDVLFVGMTAPKQEKWVNQHRHEINAKVICSIGVVFDFYAGTVNRPNSLWVNLGLEWFVRLCKEPKRMWKRYLYYGPVFMFAVVKAMLKADWVIISGYGRKTA